jgi:hypothetical protein
MWTNFSLQKVNLGAELSIKCIVLLFVVSGSRPHGLIIH